MDDNEPISKKELTKAVKSVFKTVEGGLVWRALRRASGYDSATRLRRDERTQAYMLGRASLFADLKELFEAKE